MLSQAHYDALRFVPAHHNVIERPDSTAVTLDVKKRQGAAFGCAASRLHFRINPNPGEKLRHRDLLRFCSPARCTNMIESDRSSSQKDQGKGERSQR